MPPFKMATKYIYIYCTQLVSTTDDHHHVSEYDVCPVIYFSGLRPWALGIDHTIGAVPRGRLGDGCVVIDTRYIYFICYTQLEYNNNPP